MRILKIITIFLIMILFLQCSDEVITNIEFNHTDHKISTISKEMIFSIVIAYEQFYSFSADSAQLNCDGKGCHDYLVKIEEMNNLASKLSDTNYFHWEFMTAVTPYPETDCNLFVYGKDEEDQHLDYMCTIGRGEKTSKILLGLSKSFSGEAHTAFVKIANYYKR